MTIINNRKKIQSEVPSQQYKDNWDAIFGKKPCTTFLTEEERRIASNQSLEDACIEIAKFKEDRTKLINSK